MTDTPLRIAEACDPLSRARLEVFIRAQFKAHFGAELVVSAPRLFGVYAGEALVAAYGLRTPADGLGSAIYQPEALARATETYAADTVVELVHLSLRDARIVARLLPEIALRLLSDGYRCLVCTGTACVRRMFRSRGWQVEDLGAASVDCLSVEERGRWGTYYDSQPRVLVGALRSAAPIARSALAPRERVA